MKKIDELKEQKQKLLEKINAIDAEIETLKDIVSIKTPDKDNYFFHVTGYSRDKVDDLQCFLDPSDEHQNALIERFNFDFNEKDAEKRADYTIAINAGIKITQASNGKWKPYFIISDQIKFVWEVIGNQIKLSRATAYKRADFYFKSETDAWKYRKTMEYYGLFDTYLNGLDYIYG